MHAYCIFCQTQKTEQIADAIEKILHIRCINAKIIQRYWRKGRQELRVHDYLPGYLFLYSEEPLEAYQDIARLQGVIRRLGSEDADYELTGSDYEFARMLYELDGTIGILKTVQVGDKVDLVRGLYQGFSGRIIRVDRRKGRCQIEFEFDGTVQNVWVGYEMINGNKGDQASA